MIDLLDFLIVKLLLDFLLKQSVAVELLALDSEVLVETDNLPFSSLVV